MDFTKFDNRGPAEEGTRVELVDPETGEAVTNEAGDPCIVIVRGVASRSVQAEMRKRQKAKIKKKSDSQEGRVMEDVHKELCDAAAPLILGFENVDKGKQPCKVPDDVDWFLDLTFPAMGIKEDEDGEPVTDENGVPKFEMKNNPFAKQVSDAAAKISAASGNAKAG